MQSPVCQGFIPLQIRTLCCKLKKAGQGKNGPARTRLHIPPEMVRSRKAKDKLPFTPIPNVAQVTVKGSLFGQDVFHVWHALCGPTPSGLDLSDIASGFSAGYGAVMPPLSDEYSISEIVVRDLNTATGGEFTLAITPPMTGGAATASMPGGTALCVSLRTALSGRSFRGRKYFSGIPTSEVTGNSVSPTFAASLLTGVATLLASLVTVTHPVQVASPTLGTSSQVTTAVVTDLNVDSMRRRLTGRGS